MTVRNLLGAALISLLPASAAGRTWWVKVDGSGQAPTIQAAIDSAASGDSVLIAAGLYNENLNTQGKGLTLRGPEGPEATIVDGGGRGRVLSLDSGGVVERLTLRNGHDLDGGGVRVTGSGPTVVRNNIIENNSSVPGGGGGLFLVGNITADVVIESNVVRGNSTATIGGGMLLVNGAGGPPRLFCRKNLIYNNFADEFGGGIKCDAAIVTENVIARNAATLDGGGVRVSGHVAGELSRNTVAYNRTANGVLNRAGVSASAGLVIANNLIIGNHGSDLTPSGAGIHCFGANPRCNLLWQNDFNVDWCATDPSNINQDPQFCDSNPMGSMNFFIQSDSPCAPDLGICGLIGALGVGCGTTDVQRRRWSDIKQLYR